MLLSFQTQGLNRFNLQSLFRRKFEPWFWIYDGKNEITNSWLLHPRSAGWGQQICWNQEFKLKSWIKETWFSTATQNCFLLSVCSCLSLWFVVSCFTVQSLLKLWFFLCISAPVMSGFCREKLEISYKLLIVLIFS